MTDFRKGARDDEERRGQVNERLRIGAEELIVMPQPWLICARTAWRVLSIIESVYRAPFLFVMALRRSFWPFAVKTRAASQMTVYFFRWCKSIFEMHLFRCARRGKLAPLKSRRLTQDSNSWQQTSERRQRA